jgi:hypothetical protein
MTECFEERITLGVSQIFTFRESGQELSALMLCEKISKSVQEDIGKIQIITEIIKCDTEDIKEGEQD